MTVLLASCDLSNFAGPFAVPVVRPDGYLHFAQPTFHSYGYPRTFTAGEIDCLVQSFDYFILRGSLESSDLIALAIEQFVQLGARETLLSGYLWCYGFYDPVSQVTAFIQNFGPYIDVPILYLDAEDIQSFSGLTNEQSAQWFYDAWQATRDAGWVPGLYTNKAAWDAITGGAPIPADVQQWIAGWGTPPDLSVPTADGRPGSIIGHQYTGNTADCGIFLDKSKFDSDKVHGAMTQQPPPSDVQYATEEELQRLNEATVQRFMALGAAAQGLVEAANAIATASTADWPPDGTPQPQPPPPPVAAVPVQTTASAKVTIGSLFKGTNGVPPWLVGVSRGVAAAAAVAGLQVLMGDLRAANVPAQWQPLFQPTVIYLTGIAPIVYGLIDNWGKPEQNTPS
jgi:hypothetical protein